MFDPPPSTTEASATALASGDALFEAQGSGGLWRLESGALRLDRITREGPQFVQIVLPGDLLGLELLAAEGYAYTARAVVPSLARRVALGDAASREAAMLAGLRQQQRRGEDLVALRSGPAQDRLKHLLLRLVPAGQAWPADTGGAAAFALPTIKDIAAIIDTAPETVSRMFSKLKRSQLVDDRHRQSASFSRSRLCDTEWPTGMTRSLPRAGLPTA
jgi:CRP-like cAMP-binding protein